MLQELRKYSKSWAANILLGVLSLAFVSWGIGDIFRGSVSTAVATVGDTPIEQVEFQRDYSNYLKNAGEERGKPISADEARKENLGGSLLNESVSRVTLDNASHKLGLAVSDAMVTAEIQRMQAFIGPTGQFDRTTFLQRIQQAQYTEQGFIDLIRKDSVRVQLVHAIEDGFEIPPGYARALFAYSTEMRAAEYIVVAPKSLGKPPVPTDAELQAYVKAHPDQFSTPEYRDVTFAWIGPDDVMAGIKIGDDQIKQVYDTNQDRFITPEKRELQQINFANGEEAQKARAKIKAGSSFEQVAAANGQKAADITLGELVAADLDASVGAEQSKAVFSLPLNGVTEPLKLTTGGWALIRVTKVTPGKVVTLDQARPDISKQLMREQADTKLTTITNAYMDASNGGKSPTEAAKIAGMHTGRVTAMDRNGLAPDGTKAAAPDDPDFRTQVFRAEAGEEGDPQPSKAGVYYVVSVNGIVPPKLRPLDQVRAAATAAWTAEKTAVLVREKAQELAARANRERAIDGAASVIGAKVQLSPALMHRTADATFSAPLVAALFQAVPGQAVSGPTGDGGAYIVARVTGIFHPPLPVNDPLYREGVRGISNGVASGITESYVAALKAKQGVKINYKLLNAVLGGEAEAQ